MEQPETYPRDTNPHSQGEFITPGSNSHNDKQAVKQVEQIFNATPAHGIAGGDAYPTANTLPGDKSGSGASAPTSGFRIGPSRRGMPDGRRTVEEGNQGDRGRRRCRWLQQLANTARQQD